MHKLVLVIIICGVCMVLFATIQMISFHNENFEKHRYAKCQAIRERPDLLKIDDVVWARKYCNTTP